MFDYNEKNLFYRCAYDKKLDTSKENSKKEVVTSNFHDGYTTFLVLETFLGYIKVENIKEFKDIFKPKLYQRDITEWLGAYHKGEDSHSDAIVKRLSKKLGKHWK